MSLLCWERRDAPVWGKRGNALSIAKQVYEYEMGITGEKKPRYTDENFDASFMNPDDFKVRDDDGFEYAPGCLARLGIISAALSLRGRHCDAQASARQ